MRKVKIPIECLEILFKSLHDWAVLRNSDIVDNLSRGGDCDIICLNPEKSGEKIVEILGNPLRIAKRSYVKSYYYPWGHIDLTDHIYWQGLVLLKGEDVLKNCKIEKGIPVVNSQCQGVIVLLNSLLWGGFIKKRYTDLMLDEFSQKNSDIFNILSVALGRKAALFLIENVKTENWNEIEKKVKSLRFSIRKHHFGKYPLRSFVGLFNFIRAELKLRISPSISPLVINTSKNFPVSKLESLVIELNFLREFNLKFEQIQSKRKLWVYLRFRWILFINSSFIAKNGILIFMVSDFPNRFIFLKNIKINPDELNAKNLGFLIESTCFKFSKIIHNEK